VLTLSAGDRSLRETYVVDLAETRLEHDEAAFAAVLDGETYTTQYRRPFYSTPEDPKYAVHNGTYYRLGANSRDDLPRHFFDRINKTVDTAWNMAAGGDHQFPETEGSKPRGTDILNWYLSRLFRKAHTDG